MPRIFCVIAASILLATFSISPASAGDRDGSVQQIAKLGGAVGSRLSDTAAVQRVRTAVVILPFSIAPEPGAAQEGGTAQDRDFALMDEAGTSHNGGSDPQLSPETASRAAGMSPVLNAGPSRQIHPHCGNDVYRPSGFLRADAEFRRLRLYPLMRQVACEYEIPVGLFDAMIIQESRYRPDAVSVRDAYGLTQLMAGTAAALRVNRYDQEANLRGGAQYLRAQVDRFGRYHLALAAYNAGPGRIRGGRIPRIAETEAYVSQILTYWSRLTANQVRFGAVSDAPVKVLAAPRMATVVVFE